MSNKPKWQDLPGVMEFLGGTAILGGLVILIVVIEALVP